MTVVTIEGKFFHTATCSRVEPWLTRLDGSDYEWEENFSELDNGVRRWTSTVEVDSEDLCLNLGEVTLEEVLDLREGWIPQRYLFLKE